MIDIITFIYIIAIGNLLFAGLVWIYTRTLHEKNPYLQLWVWAKLLFGISFAMSWAQPFLPHWLTALSLINNIFQALAISFELAAYAGFLGIQAWRRLPWIVFPVLCVIFFMAFFLSSTRNTLLVVVSLAGGIIYAAMGLLLLKNRAHDRLLVLVLGSVDLVLACILILRGGMGLFIEPLVRYSASNINIVMYTMLFVALMANGFGFLLLVKQEGDRALHKALADLAAIDAAQRELLTVASHEFRTPAAMIKISLDALAYFEDELSPEVISRHDNIRHAAQRMVNLANTLITRDRLIDKAFKPNKQILDLRQLVADVLAGYPVESRITAQFTDESIHIDADPALICIALHNLIDNAISHTASTTSTSTSEMVKVTLEVTNLLAKISIADHGPGIPDEAKHLIFERFYSGKGQFFKGVGLFIVSAITHAHNGNIVALDNKPTGSVLVLSLPTVDEAH